MVRLEDALPDVTLCDSISQDEQREQFRGDPPLPNIILHSHRRHASAMPRLENGSQNLALLLLLLCADAVLYRATTVDDGDDERQQKPPQEVDSFTESAAKVVVFEKESRSDRKDDDEAIECSAKQRNDTTPKEDKLFRQRSFLTPRLVNSFRLERLHEQQQQPHDVHWLLGMLYVWVRNWYWTVHGTLLLFPAFLWPIVIVMMIVMPVVPLLIIPITTAVYHRGHVLVAAVAEAVPTPTAALRWIRWITQKVRDWWNRFLAAGARQRAPSVLAAAIAAHFIQTRLLSPKLLRPRPNHRKPPLRQRTYSSP